MKTQTLLKSARGALVATAFVTAGFIAIPANAETYYLTDAGSITRENVWTNSTGEVTTLLDDVSAADHADDWFMINGPYAGKVVNTDGSGDGNSQDHYFNTHIGFQGWARLFFYGQSLDGCTLHLTGNSHLYFCGPNSNPSEMPSIKSNASIIVEGGTHGSPSSINTWHQNSWVENLGVELKCPISGNGYLCLTSFDVTRMTPIVLNPQTEGGNSNFTGALHIKGGTNSLGVAQLQEVRVMTPDALGGDPENYESYGLELDYAKLVVSADVTTAANREFFMPNDSEISVDEGKTLTVLGRHYFANKLTKSGMGTLYLRGGTVAGNGDFTVEEGTLKVGHSESTFDLFGVNVASNATLEITESGAKIQGHIILDGGKLIIPEGVSVVSNGTENVADQGVYIRPLGNASLVMGAHAELDIRALSIWDDGMLNITAPESAKVRLLGDVYNPAGADILSSRLAHITYNGSLATIGDNYTLMSVDSDSHFDKEANVELKDGSVTLDTMQAAWLNCCIDNVENATKEGVIAAAANLTRKEFDEAYMLNLDIANPGTYKFGVASFEVLRDYEDETHAFGNYAKICVRLERSNPVGNFAFGKAQIFVSPTLEGLESNPAARKFEFGDAEDYEPETELDNWKVKEAELLYPLFLKAYKQSAFFKTTLVPVEFEE